MKRLLTEINTNIGIYTMGFVASSFLTSTNFFRLFKDYDSAYGLSLITMWLTSTAVTLLYAAAAKEKV
jgi:hypothetical protein